MAKVREVIKSYSRFILVLIALGAAFAFVMFQGGMVSWTIFYTVLPFFAYSISLFFYPLSNLKAAREVQTPNVQSGGQLRVTVKLKRSFRFPILYLNISEKWQDEGQLRSVTGQSHKLFLVGFRKELIWNYELKEMPRGAHLLKGVEVELMDFFLWIRKRKFFPLKNKVFVYPKIIDLKYSPVASRSEFGVASTLFNVMKDTTTVTGIRNYESGDRISLIHWKSFARTGELMTKEFENSKSRDLFLILDARQSAAFEEQIVLAASIIKVAMEAQVEIGFMSTPRQENRTPSKQSTYLFLKTEAHHLAVLRHLTMITPMVGDFTAKVGEDEKDFTKKGKVLIITGNPDLLFLQSVLGSSFNPSSVICFVVAGNRFPGEAEIRENIELAKRKGINVQVTSLNQFSQAFNEVTYL